MPELPEVETIKLQLAKKVNGLKIAAIEIRTPKMFTGDKKELIGLTIEKVERMGKMIVINLKSKNEKIKKEINLLIHLKLTGRLIFDKKEYEKEKHTHIVITFTNGKKLYFWDMRKFGWIKVITNDKLLINNNKIGIDPLTKEFSVDMLKNLLEKSKKPIKIFLMEQEKIAGIGNIYANEALFSAKINPQRKSSALLPKETEKLFTCLREVLNKGLKYNGASDNSFRLLDGSLGQMQNHFLVYGKKGKSCPNNCGEKIVRIALGGRGTFFCPKCQKN